MAGRSMIAWAKLTTIGLIAGGKAHICTVQGAAVWLTGDSDNFRSSTSRSRCSSNLVLNTVEIQHGEAMSHEDAMLILMIAHLFVAIMALGR